jgi:hypothetical protein
VSRASTRSTSSAPTEHSPPWTDLSKLGEYIVAQLVDERGDPNLLAHWIAQRLAEHLSEAENAEEPERQEAARAAAATLVPQIWGARRGWPWGWPPDAVKNLVEGVRAAQSRHVEPKSPHPWLATLSELETLHQEERRVWVYGALLELGATALQAALDAAPASDANADDIATIRWQLRVHREAEQWLADGAEEGERTTRRADRARVFDRALTQIAEQRAALVGRSLVAARRGRRRTRSASRERRGASRVRPNRDQPGKP